MLILNKEALDAFEESGGIFNRTGDENTFNSFFYIQLYPNIIPRPKSWPRNFYYVIARSRMH
jgi:hypothetical protein